jgi:hypothetical protein
LIIAWKVPKLIVPCDSARVKFTDESAILLWSASNQDGVVGKFRPQRTINFGNFHAIKCLIGTEILSVINSREIVFSRILKGARDISGAI